jgi:hypothetical protein
MGLAAFGGVCGGLLRWFFAPTFGLLHQLKLPLHYFHCIFLDFLRGKLPLKLLLDCLEAPLDRFLPEGWAKGSHEIVLGTAEGLFEVGLIKFVLRLGGEFREEVWSVEEGVIAIERIGTLERVIAVGVSSLEGVCPHERGRIALIFVEVGVGFGRESWQIGAMSKRRVVVRVKVAVGAFGVEGEGGELGHFLLWVVEVLVQSPRCRHQVLKESVHPLLELDHCVDVLAVRQLHSLHHPRLPFLPRLPLVVHPKHRKE